MLIAEVRLQLGLCWLQTICIVWESDYLLEQQWPTRQGHLLTTICFQ